MARPTLYHVPICPFSQRIEILLNLKGLNDVVDFHVIDITKPRPDWLLALTRGTTALPAMDVGDGRALKESLVILHYVEDRFCDTPIQRTDPYERAIERLMITEQDGFATAGYAFVMNRDPARTETLRAELLGIYARLSSFLDHNNPGGTFLFDTFGFADLVFTPLMMRFWFLEYYEGFDLPETPEFARARKWRAACLAHPAAQQVTPEEINKLYYDYAVGAGNGALPEGRRVSSFTFDPPWRARPMPPRDKYDRIATDAELGLI